MSRPLALVIGDSHVDDTDAYLNSKTACFGTDLARELQAKGYDVQLAGVGGSRAAQWLTGEPVCRPDTSKCVDPGDLPSADLLIICLGSNDVGKAKSAKVPIADVPGQIAALAQKFGAKQTLWVGPPWMRSKSAYNNEGMAKLYDAAAAQGVPVFDSRPATKALVEAGQGDGIHSGPKSSAAWAKAVAAAVGAGQASVGGKSKGKTPWIGIVAALAIAGGLWYYSSRR